MLLHEKLARNRQSNSTLTTMAGFLLLLLIFAALPNVYAWGASGHQAVGYVDLLASHSSQLTV